MRLDEPPRERIVTSCAGVRITHPDKVLFPAAGITKAEFAAHVAAAAPAMLRHLRQRPLMLQRFPSGVSEHGFVQKDFGDALPQWFHRIRVAKADGSIEHPLATSRRALVWLANQNCITVHCWLSRADRLQTPDRIVIDLDPASDSAEQFRHVCQCARDVAELLCRVGLVPFVQTTGSRGLHVVTPLRAQSGFDEVREFARELAEAVAARDPENRTVEMRKEQRGGRVYLDIMRNAYAQTAVAPYAVRASARAPVATPLRWDELDDPALRPDGVTLGDLAARLEHHGDPWAQIGRHARSLSGPHRALMRIRA